MRRNCHRCWVLQICKGRAPDGRGIEHLEICYGTPEGDDPIRIKSSRQAPLDLDGRGRLSPRKHLREQRGRARLLDLYQGMASSHTA